MSGNRRPVFLWLLRAILLLPVAVAPFVPLTGCQYPTAPPSGPFTSPSSEERSKPRPAKLNVMQVAYWSPYTDQYDLISRPAKNHRFVWVHAKVTNVGSAALHVGPSDFRLYSETTYSEPEAFDQPRGHTMFGSAELQPGKPEQGWLLFHVLKAPRYSLKFIAGAGLLSDFTTGAETRTITVATGADRQPVGRKSRRHHRHGRR